GGTRAEHGLQGAVRELAERSPITVAVAVPAARFPAAVEAAAYFVCAESLTNVAKHAEASQVHMTITQENGRLKVVIADDGIGGAGPSRSFGLRGLADRGEGLGGSLAGPRPPGGGARGMGGLACGRRYFGGGVGPSPIVAVTECCQDWRMARAWRMALLVAGLALGVFSLAVARGGAGNSFGGGSAFAGAAELAAGYALLAVGLVACMRPRQARL